ncbi:MAG: MOSC domain-containing protein [Pseudorhizobium pelagicum]|uniref:MOSC domain-containing protein n=1 Tax=Pseudorhizobium pelagicum TaxID=1509405 RepID=UPI00345FFD51
MTTASLDHLAGIGAAGVLDRRRFRPSVLIESFDGEGFVENDWIGRTLRIGEAEIAVTEPTRRCGMTLLAQPGVAEDPNVLRTIMRHNGRNFGAYGTPAAESRIAVGDPVYAES